MRADAIAGDLLATVRGQWRLMLAVVPGVMLTMIHSTALDLPRADLIGALDSDHYRIQWVFGSYILGNAVGMALTGYAGSRIGLRWAYLAALILFAAASGACAFTTDTFWMAPLRLLQGLGTGLVISVAMVLLWRAFPVRKELAMAVYGMAVYLSALSGAAAGGLLTALVSWRLVFLINLPAGILMASIALIWLPPDRPAGQPASPFDWFGLGLLAAFVVTMNVVLDMGQYWGWLTSPSFVPWLVGLVISLVAFVAWGIGAARPLINLRILTQPHFTLGLSIKVLYSMNLYVMVGLLSGYMINLRGYQWQQGSLVFLPGLVAMALALLVGTSLATNRNRKLRMFLGLAAMTVATAGLSVIDLYTAKGWQAAHLALWGAGAGLVVGPALLTTFEGLSTEQTLQTAGVFNIMRSLPTFAVSSFLVTLLARHTDANFDWLRQDIHANRPVVAEAIRSPAGHFVQQGSGPHMAAKQAHAFLGRWVRANSRAFAFRDLFQLLAVVPALGLLLVLPVGVPGQVR